MRQVSSLSFVRRESSDAGIRGRLDQLSKLVECALSDLGFVEADMNLVRERTWQLLSKLTVLMPRTRVARRDGLVGCGE